MALHVRHYAWLNAVPDADKGDKSIRKSRREALEAEGIEPDMPPLDWGEYLVHYLFEFGPVAATGMGNVPVPPPYIESWQRQTGLTLSPWEFSVLLRLSSEYMAESYKSSDPVRPPPFTESSDAARLRMAELNRKLSTFLD